MTTDQVDVGRAAHGLADALEGKWKVFPGHWGTCDRFVRSAAGEGLHVQEGDFAGRLAVTGEYGVGDENLYDFWPQGKNRWVLRSHGITVSAAKSPAQVARDVERRLLPAYRLALAEARAKKKVHDEREAATARLVAELAGILGGRAVAHAPGTVRIGEGGSALHGGVRVTSRDVEFTLTVPRELALNLAARVAAGS